jgi:hypothetical protein
MPSDLRTVDYLRLNDLIMWGRCISLHHIWTSSNTQCSVPQVLQMFSSGIKWSEHMLNTHLQLDQTHLQSSHAVILNQATTLQYVYKIHPGTTEKRSSVDPRNLALGLACYNKCTLPFSGNQQLPSLLPSLFLFPLLLSF